MLRRALSLLIGLAVLAAPQYAGAGHVAACAIAGHVAESGAAPASGGMSGMPGMAESGMNSATDGGADARLASATAAPAADAAPCDHDTSSRACMAAAACTAVPMGLPRGEHDVAASHARERIVVAAGLMPPSVTTPPDLRPPRA